MPSPDDLRRDALAGIRAAVDRGWYRCDAVAAATFLGEDFGAPPKNRPSVPEPVGKEGADEDPLRLQVGGVAFVTFLCVSTVVATAAWLRRMNKLYEKGSVEEEWDGESDASSACEGEGEDRYPLGDVKIDCEVHNRPDGYLRYNDEVDCEIRDNEEEMVEETPQCGIEKTDKTAVITTTMA
mmetsp:Transcript_35265/g.81659  ORF Transcript_35265/g.81659 Transcript_35265/m.81659 type:complete len:182 (-) Transcript_35265:495-1040(-)